MSMPFSIARVTPYGQKRMAVLKSLDLINREIARLQAMATDQPGLPYAKLINESHLNNLKIYTQLLEEWVLDNNQKTSL